MDEAFFSVIGMCALSPSRFAISKKKTNNKAKQMKRKEENRVVHRTTGRSVGWQGIIKEFQPDNYLPIPNAWSACLPASR